MSGLTDYQRNQIELAKSRPGHKPKLGPLCPCSYCRTHRRAVDAYAERLRAEREQTGKVPF